MLTIINACERYSSDWHVQFGLHSNIPICCIKFWLDSYYVADLYLTGYINKHSMWADHWREHNHKCGYIACPDCVHNNRINKLMRCNQNHKQCIYRG